MIYINSEGESVETDAMYPQHLVNALIKTARQSAASDTGKVADGPEQVKIEANLNVLKAEVLARLTNNPTK